jgi:outer membrane protein TolC
MKILTVALLLVVVGARAQNNLEHFLRIAETNSPLLKEYANQLSSSSLQKEAIRSQQQLPQVSLSAGYLFAPFFNNNGHIVSATPDPQAIGYDVGITNGGLYSAQISVEKNIFNGPLIDALTGTQEIQEASINHSLSMTRRDLHKQVTDLYLQTYESQKLYELGAETAGIMKDLLRVLGNLVERGASKQSEYLLLSIECEGKTIAAADARVQYATNLNQLNSLCGIVDTAVVPVDSVFLAVRADAPGFAFAKKYELDSLSALVQQQLFETKYQPQVALFVNTGLNAVELDNIERKFGVSAGVSVSIPLFDGNQRSIARQQNQLSLQSIANYRENFAIQVKNQRKNALDRLEAQRGNLASLSRQIVGYGQLIRITENELRLGHVSMIEYLTVLKNYTDLKKSRISAEADVQREITNINYWN